MTHYEYSLEPAPSPVRVDELLHAIALALVRLQMRRRWPSR